MLRFTFRALARKAPAKVSSKTAATVTPSSHATLTAPQTGVNIPPIPGVRSVRAFRSQKMMAPPLVPPTVAATKKAVAAKSTKIVPAAPKSRPSKETKMPKKAAPPARTTVPVKTATPTKSPQARRITAPKSAAKKISNTAKASKMRK
ncbi:hypothetical protein JKF63_02356 [Porcisia hertigi]|uniref:Uncharacterized protein n=1 Tax=Porcisia hertigi TaxID=2761500 RepID=A0A836L1Z6_9TRYP|nr:hypothetical protein JKF63_02356 [Porcisia hertigi]